MNTPFNDALIAFRSKLQKIIIAELDKTGSTQEKLAKNIGISCSAMSRLMNDERFSKNDFNKICNYLNLELNFECDRK